MKEEQMSKEVNLSRRSFLKGAALVGAAGVGAAALVGCTSDPAGSAEGTPSYLPASWDAEADMIIVGFGAGGAAAAITAAHEDLGSTIVLEAGPVEYAGGNSRVCGQNILIPTDVEDIIIYQKALNAEYKLDEDPAKEDALYRAWATEICKNKEWLESLGAIVTETEMNSREFPEVAGSEAAQCYLIDNVVGQQALWNVLKGETDYLETDVRYETRAVRLVRNPERNETLGVEAEQNGKTLFFKAKKGVILSCGGFENGENIQRTYYPAGSSWSGLLGTPYNRGDGFYMVAPFGAKLRSMTNYTGPTWSHRVSGEDSPFTWKASFSTKDWIYIGPDSKRFMNEEYLDTARHTKLRINGVWQHPPFNTPSHTIFGQKAFDALAVKPSVMGIACIDNTFIADSPQGYLDAGVIKKADTVEELAKILGREPEALTKTISEYNAACVTGIDHDFKRGQPIELNMAAINAGGASEEETSGADAAATAGFQLEAIEGPFYALEMVSTMGNTQGGPVRGVDGEVIDVFGDVVPRLYGAGEFGTIYGFMYNGGGNVSEAMSSGRIAIRHASTLESWDTGTE
jgi:succinate dehydrogenase/fumarate reductase flavoprotein subunit